MGVGRERIQGEDSSAGLFCLRVVPGSERRVAALLASAGQDVCLPTAVEVAHASALLLLTGVVVFEAQGVAGARRVVRQVPGISDCALPGTSPEPLDAEASEAIRVLAGVNPADSAAPVLAMSRLPISRVSRTKRHAYVRLRLPDGPHELAVPLTGLG